MTHGGGVSPSRAFGSVTGRPRRTVASKDSRCLVRVARVGGAIHLLVWHDFATWRCDVLVAWAMGFVFGGVIARTSSYHV